MIYNHPLQSKMSAINSLPINEPSICIPRVFNNIDEQRVAKVFQSLNIASIERIDIIQRTNDKGESFKRVYIHFYAWNNTSDAVAARTKLLEGKEIKIVYDDPWYWKVSANTSKPDQRRSGPRKAAPHIAFEEKRNTREDRSYERRPERRPRDNREERSYERRSRGQDNDQPRRQNLSLALGMEKHIQEEKELENLYGDL